MKIQGKHLIESLFYPLWTLLPQSHPCNQKTTQGFIHVHGDNFIEMDPEFE